MARQARGVRLGDLARHMGISSPRLTEVESKALPTNEMAHRYLTALEEL